MASGDAPADALALDADVEAVEPVGAESFLYCAAAGSRIVVRVSGRAAAEPGDRLRVVARRPKSCTGSMRPESALAEWKATPLARRSDVPACRSA